MRMKRELLLKQIPIKLGSFSLYFKIDFVFWS